MSHSRQEDTDRIAREAARLIETGRSRSIAAAIRSAVESLNIDAPPPSHALVRRHAQHMSMQHLGEAGYKQRVQDVYRAAEEMMATLEHAIGSVGGDCETHLVGRAASGQIDAGVTIHIRVYTREKVKRIAAELVSFGYAEPKFETADTKYGRFDRMRFEDAEIGADILVTRIHPEVRLDRTVNLFTGDSVTLLTLDALQARLQ